MFHNEKYQIMCNASVAQGIEQWFPVPCFAGVRIPPDAFLKTGENHQFLF